jgi:hypothetical protein
MPVRGLLPLCSGCRRFSGAPSSPWVYASRARRSPCSRPPGRGDVCALGPAPEARGPRGLPVRGPSDYPRGFLSALARSCFSGLSALAGLVSHLFAVDAAYTLLLEERSPAKPFGGAIWSSSGTYRVGSPSGHPGRGASMRASESKRGWGAGAKLRWLSLPADRLLIENWPLTAENWQLYNAFRAGS